MLKMIPVCPIRERRPIKMHVHRWAFGNIQPAYGTYRPVWTPEIVEAHSLQRRPNDATYYGKGTAFEVDVKGGLRNELTLLADGVSIGRTDGSAPNGAQLTYSVKRINQDAFAWTVVSRVSVIPPAPFPDGKVIKFTLVETSINPRYAGINQQRASRDFTVPTVTKPCVVSVTAPDVAEPLVPFAIRWEAKDCKRYEFAVNSQILDSQVFPNPASSITKADNYTAATLGSLTFAIHGENASGDGAGSVKATAVFCPNVPGGGYQQFSFAVNCTGACSTWLQGACNESQAADIVKIKNQGCSVSAGACLQ